MESRQIAAILENEFRVRIEWIGEKSFMIIIQQEVSSQEAEEMRPKIDARMKELMSSKVKQ